MVVTYVHWRIGDGRGVYLAETVQMIYGLLFDPDNELCGYPIKAGTYPINIRVTCESTDPVTKAVTRRGSATIAADIVVTGDPVGSWYDREVMHHASPTAVLAKHAADAALTQAVAANDAAGSAARVASAARADASSIKEDQDRMGARVADLVTRVAALEAAGSDTSDSSGTDD